MPRVIARADPPRLHVTTAAESEGKIPAAKTELNLTLVAAARARDGALRHPLSRRGRQDPEEAPDGRPQGPARHHRR